MLPSQPSTVQGHFFGVDAGLWIHKDTGDGGGGGSYVYTQSLELASSSPGAICRQRSKYFSTDLAFVKTRNIHGDAFTVKAINGTKYRKRSRYNQGWCGQ